MKPATELALLCQQRTWDKDLVLWVGSETRLRQLIGALPVVVLDLLDLFDPDRLPMDDDDTRTELQRNLRTQLRKLAPEPGNRLVLLVRSAGLLARYQTGVQDFYQWFCHDFAMAILILDRLPAEPFGTEEVICVPGRLLQYFRAPEVVKQVYGEEG